MKVRDVSAHQCLPSVRHGRAVANWMTSVWPVGASIAILGACSILPLTDARDSEQTGLLEATARDARASVVFVHPGPGRTGGAGVGFIISSQGYILTNAHVVAGMADVEVILFDGRKLRGRLVGAVESKKPDVAVLKVDAGTALPALGFSDVSELGDTVLAIDHPGMTAFWVPISGTVAGVERESVRVDMPSFYGMSGAPLLDQRGRVVGMIYGTVVPRVEQPIPAPMDVVTTWEEFGWLKPPVSAVSVDALKREVDRILGSER